MPDRRSRVLAREEARTAQTAGLAAALGHLGWAVAVLGTSWALFRPPGLAPEWAAAVLLAVVAVAEPLAGLPDAAVARRRAAAARDRLARLAAMPGTDNDRAATAAPPRVRSGPADPRPEEHSGPTGRQGIAIAIRGLVAGWDEDRPALRGLDLDVPAGGRVAVRGASGSGKSTLAAVLTGFLEARAGTITPDLPPGLVGLVSDDADHVFATTVRENLRLARPGAGDDELLAVLRRVGLGDWSHGLDDRLGTGGGTISGGQRRRLAAARALLADPRVLVLDEPTEGLDEAGARALMADLLDAASGRTVVLLCHRPDGLDLVDEVWDLVDGRLTGARVPVVTG